MNKLALFSVPRSGSTWLGEIINSSPDIIYRFQPNFAYSFDNKLHENSNEDDINTFFKELLQCNDEFVNGRLSISGKKRNLNFYKYNNASTLFFKETHFLNVIENLLIKSDTKVIGLVRSPFAVINSWIKIPKEFHPDWKVKEEWKKASKKNQGKASHFFGYEKWKEACFLFLALKEKFPNRFYIVNYKDMLNNPTLETKNLFEFCELELTYQTKLFLKESSSKNSKDEYGVFKSKLNDLDWKNNLPTYIIKDIKADIDFMKLKKQFKWKT